MKLMTKFNLILLVVFGIAGITIAQLANNFLISDARRQVAGGRDDAGQCHGGPRLSNLQPLLTHRLRANTTFHPEWVPAFSATTTFNKLREHYPAYGYKEATLNPTNPEDRATDWEADIIRMFREDPKRTRIVGECESPDGPVLYLAGPIVMTPPCLECHSVPATTLPSMNAI